MARKRLTKCAMLARKLSAALRKRRVGRISCRSLFTYTDACNRLWLASLRARKPYVRILAVSPGIHPCECDNDHYTGLCTDFRHLRRYRRLRILRPESTPRELILEWFSFASLFRSFLE